MSLYNNKAYTLLVVIALIMLAGLVTNLGNVFLIVVESLQNETGHIFVKLIAMGMGFILIPRIILKRLDIQIKDKSVQIGVVPSVLLLVIILLVNFLWIKSSDIFTALIVAICEEYLFRYLAHHILIKTFSHVATVFITSFLFGVLLHINGDFWLNVFIKIPAGYVLSYLGVRFGLQYSVAFHWLHNVLIGKFF